MSGTATAAHYTANMKTYGTLPGFDTAVIVAVNRKTGRMATGAG